MKPTAKEFVKHIVQRVSPRAFTLLQASRRRLYFWHRHGRHQGHSAGRIFNGTGPRILSGPFKGMSYLNETVWGPIEPKWIGCYEEELQGIIEKVVDARYTTVIDIGSAEGYYAVGLAWRCPQARVFSYDTDIWARRQQLRLARLNGVKNLEIGAYCSWDDITRRVLDRTFVLCDIEGYEYDLLDPAACPALQRVDILVEVHPSGALDTRSVCDALTARFATTHATMEIGINGQRSRYVAGMLGGRLSAPEIERYVDEWRSLPDQRWLWLETRSR